MRRVDRRGFLKTAGAAGAFGAGAVLSGRDLVRAQAQEHIQHMQHGGHGAVGLVDNERNGFDPHEILTDFDGGSVSKDVSGRTVREYEFVATTKDIEVAPGVF